MTRQTIERLDKRIKALEGQRESAIKDMQTNCDHPLSECLEGRYRRNTYFSDSPPFRVCKLCGLAEEGWGPYKQLPRTHDKNLIHEVDRDYAFSFVLTFNRQPLT